jgi:hypothetical protein
MTFLPRRGSPLEDLLVRHGASLVDELDDLTRDNPRFAEP